MALRQANRDIPLSLVVKNLIRFVVFKTISWTGAIVNIAIQQSLLISRIWTFVGIGLGRVYDALLGKYSNNCTDRRQLRAAVTAARRRARAAAPHDPTWVCRFELRRTPAVLW